ncbi:MULTISPECIES: dephospho-CoA kinase [Vibrio]|uniref:Dephospho-CoA kinase n=1 Tax=Vibrio algicola TaxID=2662262 RepID=A0A5Q0TDN3_9VIBR|nr:MULTISPECIES: dephospho-CoA kinase [Vibrio]MBD1576553.1 dephospho-CoA kinase [Vibrio sp. S11_S32]
MIIGLTGGIGSGKTSIANLFHQHFNIDLVDADIVARQVVQPNTLGLNAIVQHFGDSILTDTGELDRRQLRERIFSAPSEKQWINDLLHPLIRTEIKRQLQHVTSPYVILVVPLLVESEWKNFVDRILVVDASEQTQIERTCSRDSTSQTQVRAILASQASRQERLSFADDVINNDADLNPQTQQALLLQVTALHQKYLDISPS